MARRARGAEVLEMAREMVARAETLEPLRQAQAVVLPLDFGLSMEQTAQAIGRSPEWTCRLRNRFLAGEIVGDLKVPPNIHLLPLPPYAPELNPVEHEWN